MKKTNTSEKTSEQVENITLNPTGQEPIVATFAFDVPVRIISIETRHKKSPGDSDGFRVVGILNGHPDAKVELARTLETLKQTVCTINGASGPRQAHVEKVECDERSFVISLLADLAARQKKSDRLQS